MPLPCFWAIINISSAYQLMGRIYLFHKQINKDIYMLGLAKLQRYHFTRVYGNFVNGEFVDSKASKFYEIRSPVTQDLIAKSPQSTPEEFNHIVSVAKEAYKTWSNVPLLSTCHLYSF